MLLNLLSNAVKFTPEGGRVTVRTALTGEGVRVSVEDTGMGIAAQDRERIFEAFHQDAHSGSRQPERHRTRPRTGARTRRAARRPFVAGSRSGDGKHFQL